MDSRTARTVGQNLTRMLLATDGWVHIETHHGAVREGRLSGWTLADISFNGVTAHLPIALELNGDPGDVIRLTDIRKLDVDPKRPA